MAKKTDLLKVLGRPVVRIYTRGYYSETCKGYRENLVVRDFTGK